MRKNISNMIPALQLSWSISLCPYWVNIICFLSSKQWNKLATQTLNNLRACLLSRWTMQPLLEKSRNNFYRSVFLWLFERESIKTCRNSDKLLHHTWGLHIYCALIYVALSWDGFHHNNMCGHHLHTEFGKIVCETSCPLQKWIQLPFP